MDQECLVRRLRDVTPENRSPFNLGGRRALVIGATSDIGRAAAVALARAGGSVSLVGRRLDVLDAVREEVARAGGEVCSIPADVTNREELENAFDATHRVLGGLDILVNVAGVHLRKPALEISEEEFDSITSVNLKATFFSCQAAARRMVGRGGAIVNVSSLTAFIGLRNSAAYAATRGGGIAQLTRALAVEWAPFGILVNAVAPGRVRTRMTEELFADDEVRTSFERLIPLGRGAVPEDISGAVVFLASDAARYITGQVLVVDGGWLAGGGVPSL
jgi:2-deoxy-D-gluconate 3-dehydrogenase